MAYEELSSSGEGAPQQSPETQQDPFEFLEQFECQPDKALASLDDIRLAGAATSAVAERLVAAMNMLGTTDGEGRLAVNLPGKPAIMRLLDESAEEQGVIKVTIHEKAYIGARTFTRPILEYKLPTHKYYPDHKSMSGWYLDPKTGNRRNANPFTQEDEDNGQEERFNYLVGLRYLVQRFNMGARRESKEKTWHTPEAKNRTQ